MECVCNLQNILQNGSSLLVCAFIGISLLLKALLKLQEMFEDVCEDNFWGIFGVCCDIKIH